MTELSMKPALFPMWKFQDPLDDFPHGIHVSSVERDFALTRLSKIGPAGAHRNKPVDAVYLFR